MRMAMNGYECGSERLPEFDWFCALARSVLWCWKVK